MTSETMERTAVLSPCDRYRYLLTRTWDVALPVLVFIMLNPSTADASIDDATIRVCIGRAKRMGYGGIVVVNLFAFRATNPWELLSVEDPVGPANDGHIRRVLNAKPKMVIAAWGGSGHYLDRARRVAHLCDFYRVPLHCLGTTQAGEPRHPLRISYDVAPQPWLGGGHQHA